MQIALEESQEDFVKQAVSDGRYTSESAVVEFGIRLLQAREQKLAELRAKVQESLKDTSEVSDEDIDAAINRKSQELLAKGIPW